MSHTNDRIWAVMPAAGSGQRMQATIPKQYLPLHHQPVIAHSLERLLSCELIEKIIVAVDHDDQHWSHTRFATHPKIQTVQGGEYRCQSVLNGVAALENSAEKNDWVLVHDAVRPCLSLHDLDNLITQTINHPVGGILGAPLTGTIKRVNENNEIVTTIDRNHLWQALTPQLLRYEILLEALTAAVNAKNWVTDEAAAVELIGLQPLIVQGTISNIKITHQDDLVIAQRILQSE